MNRTNLIVTHVAVFAVGITAAMVFNGSRQAAQQAPDSANPLATHTTSSRSAGSASGDDSSRITGKSQDRGREALSREKRPVSEQLKTIVSITDPFQRQRALMDMIDTLSPDQFESVATQFREMDHYGGADGGYELILRGWAKADPLSALDYIGKTGNSRGARSTVLSTWAGNDAAGAERWATDNFDGKGANPLMVSVIRGIASTDISRASELALGMPHSGERADAVEAITRALFMQGIDAAMAYPDSITTDDHLRGGFVAEIAERIAGRDPDKAATWLASMDQGDVQNRAARRVADALARTDSKKAAAWVATLKPEAQAEAARGVIPIMSSSDIAGTAKWVSGLAGAPGFDKVVEEFVWSCDQRAPEQSAAWIQGIADPKQQERTYHRMLGDWAKKDPAAVKQWVATNTVPDSVFKRYSK